MVNVTNLRSGTTFQLDGAPYQVLSYTHTKIGRGGANVRIQARNLRTGAIEEKTFGSNEKVEEATAVKRRMQYLYSGGKNAVFMDPTTFEQVEIPQSAARDQIKFVKETEVVNVLFVDDHPLLIELPPKVTLTVKNTEPGVRGNSATNIWKTATLENDLQVKVPLFIEIGDKVRVDTRTAEYVERFK